MSDIILDQLNLKTGDIVTQAVIDTIDENTTKTQDAINSNSDKLGDLTGNGLTETDLATAIKNDRSQLSKNVQQIRTTQNNPTNYSGAIVTFIDDDATWLYPQWWDSILSNKNINITLATITSKVGTGGYMTLQQLKDRQAQGNDIVSHSETHSDFGTLTPTQADTECKNSQQWLKDNNFDGYDTFVYPGGLLSTNVALKNVTRKYYTHGVATWDADNIHVNTMPVDNWALKRIFIATNTLDQLKLAVDNANANNQWLIVLSHSADFVQADSDKISSFIDYVKGKNIPILKFSEAVKYKGNAVALGEYTDSSSTFIGINGSIKSPIKVPMSVNSATASNSMDAVISTYPKDVFTTKVLDGDTDTCIHNGGIMTVFRSSAHDLYTRALFYPYQYNRVYSRRWDFTNLVWLPWERVDKTDIALTVDAGNILNQPITYFEKRMVYMTPVSNSINAPDGSTGGVLNTYRMVDDTYSYQIYKFFNAKTTYHRRWATSAWSAWELVS